jgi:hypothetical protein
MHSEVSKHLHHRSLQMTTTRSHSLWKKQQLDLVPTVSAQLSSDSIPPQMETSQLTELTIELIDTKATLTVSHNHHLL